MTAKLKIGTQFIHKQWLDENMRPLECIVTKIGLGGYYYRPIQGGSPMWFAFDEVEKRVKEVL